MTVPGDSDVVAGGAGLMGPCPPPQHQPPGGVLHILYYVYTMYIQSICIVYRKIYYIYTKYIPSVFWAYTMYKQGIYNVYTKDIPYSIFHEYSWYITGILKRYTRYIPGIFQSYAVLTNMPGIYLLHNKWVYTRHIGEDGIWLIYTR